MKNTVLTIRINKLNTNLFQIYILRILSTFKKVPSNYNNKSNLNFIIYFTTNNIQNFILQLKELLIIVIQVKGGE